MGRGKPREQVKTDEGYLVIHNTPGLSRTVCSYQNKNLLSLY